MIVASIVLFFLAIVTMGTTVLAASGVLKRNAVAGIRVHYYVVSQTAWEAGHLAALLPITIGSVLAIAGGLTALARPASGGIVALAFVLFLAMLVWGILRGDRAALDAIARDTGEGSGE